MISKPRQAASAMAGFVCLSMLLAVSLATGLRAETRAQVEIPSLTKGKPLEGTLFTPDGAGTNPAVLVLAPGDGVPERADINYAQALARNGFVALAVSYQANSPKNVGRWSPRTTNDLVGIVNWLRARPEVGGKRVGAVGFSAGSHAILLSAKNAAVRAVVVYYGPYNLRKYVKAGATAPASFQFPIDKAGEVNGAVLLLHGDKDDEVPVIDAQEMRDALTAAGKTVELVVYPGAYHRFERGNVAGANGDIGPTGFTYKVNPEATNDAWVRSLAWLNTHLKQPPAR